MLSQGLSFIIFNASNQQEVQETISFYEAIGFHVVSDKAYKERTVWLRSKSNTTIQLVLNSKAKKQAKPSTDSDWSLEEIALAFYTENLQEIKSKLASTPVQDHSKDGDVKLYAIDPLNNIIVFTNKAIEITNNAVEAINTAITANSQKKRQKIAVLTSGGDAPGMNAVVRAVVRYGITKGCDIFAVYEGYQGLVDGGDLLKKMDWKSVRGWLAVGGTTIGTARCMPFKTREGRLQAAENLIKNGIDSLIVCGGDGSLTGADLFRSEWSGLVKELKETDRINVEQAETYKHLTIIQGLLVIGGFEAYAALDQLQKARQQYPSLRIPITLIPATISNNVPGTDYSLGSDTSLNSIVDSCDAIVQSAQSSRRRVFVVEVMGGRSGYLAVEAGLAVGANTVYIPEEGISLSRLQADVNHLKAMYADDDPDRSEGRIILRTEDVSKTYTTEVISNILKDEGEDMFDSRTAILGHIQQGTSPSPLDRIRATRITVRAIQFIETHASEALDQAQQAGNAAPVELTNTNQSVTVAGIHGNSIVFRPVTDLMKETDMKNRKPYNAWWAEHRPIIDLLAGRGLFSTSQ
ncbi:Putative 6-phosphofructokinase [Rhizopus microsporus]|nr:Putative 6-phosphofructokinase [Rhizopus microsporus]